MRPAILVFALLFATPCAASVPLALAPCTVPGHETKLRCGTLEVPENREAPDGRKIGLNIVVVPALEPDASHVPLYDLAGGPGLAATGSADYYLTFGAMHRQKRDVVLVDQRGTGKSALLACPELDGTGASYPDDKVKACHDRLAANADLAQYTTAATVADLEAVRTALGHEHVDLFGMSYGTRVALAWIDAAPDAIRSAVLIGTVPDDARLPLWHARNGQDALDAVLADCAADTACAAAYPQLARDWATVRANPAFDGPAREALRNKLATAPGQRNLPALIASLAADGLAPLQTPAAGFPIAEGLFLSITCIEDVPAIGDADLASATRDTFLGDWRVARQRAACTHWNVPPRELRYARASSAVPVLFLAGEKDHVTPPAWARRIAEKFPRGRVVILPGLSHVPEGVEGIECLDTLAVALSAKPDAAALDVSCAAKMKAPPFTVPE